MDALLIGTGGAEGWPEDGCHCASCMRARSDKLRRAPGRVIVDGLLEFRPGRRFMPGTRSPAATAHRITQVPGGWDLSGQDGSRLLLAAGPGQVPEPPPGGSPYGMALLDLLASPAQLGKLRQGGLVHERTAVTALYTDHRISSEQEMARRCELWGVRQGQDGQRVLSSPADAPDGRSGSADDGTWPGAVAGRPHRTLIIGGARSGKSTEAELRLSGEPHVTYLAAGPWVHSQTDQSSWTGIDGEPDTEWAQRVALHRARRPPWWRTVESLDVAALLRQESGAVLIDGIGTWLAGVMDEAGIWANERPAAPQATTGHQAEHQAEAGLQDPAEVVQARIDELVDAWRQTSALVVAVTDQVGSGLVPDYPAGRVFRDQLGWLNQRLAVESELNLHVVAGRVITLPG